jgi:hypothetical protein
VGKVHSPVRKLAAGELEGSKLSEARKVVTVPSRCKCGQRPHHPIL